MPEKANVKLLVAPCSHKAAKYAVMNWHYSKRMPCGKLVKYGVWEDDKYIGCSIFSRGANNNIGKTYRLNNTEVCELTRVALTKHKVPVSKIVSIAVKLLTKQSEGLRLIISYADPREHHEGIIYQAMNWAYVGKPKQCKSAHYIIYINGKAVEMHGRSVRSRWGKDSQIPYKWEYLIGREKHKYLYPLDKAMRKQIEPLRKPYPKRPVSETVSRPAIQPGIGGSIPTTGLNDSNAKAD